MATERIGIDLELNGYEETLRKIESIERLTSTFRGKKAMIEIGGNWDTVGNHIRTLTKELKALEAEKRRLQASGASGRGGLIGPLTEDNQALELVTNRIKAVRSELDIVRTAAQNTGRSLKQTFSAASIFVARFGSALQSLGNAFTRIAAPLRMMTGGGLIGVGFAAVSKITTGLQSGFSRYDVMHKYPLMMSEYEKATYSATDSIKELEAAVLGLPTGLDEIVDVAQRYTLSLGDMEKGTKLAIATNNAFLASMATEQQQYQGMLQLQDLMNGKNLNSREWMSLGSSMGKAINEIGKELGYSAEQMGEFRQELYAGHISTEEFLDALVKVGTGSGKIAELAELSKTTWDAIARNIGNRFSKMSQRILEAFDEMSMRVTGKTLVQYIANDVLPLINKLTDSIVAWIGNNQDKILGFLNDIKSLDFKGLARGFVSGIGDLLSMCQKFAKVMGGRSLERVGRFLAKTGFLGRFLTISGGLVKGSRHIVAFLVTATRALTEIRGLDRAGSFLGRLLKLGERGSGGGGAAEAATKTVTNFQGLLKALAGVGTIAASIAMIGGAGFVAFRSVKTIIKDIAEIIEIAHGMDFNEAATVIAGVTAFFGLFMELGFVMGNALGAGVKILAGTTLIGAITTIISGFAALDTWLIKKAMDNVRNAVQGISDTMTILKEMPRNGNLSNLKKAINDVMDIYEALKFNDGGKGIWSISLGKTKGFKKRIKAFNDVLTELKGSVESISSLEPMPDVESAKYGIRELVYAIGEIYDAADEEFDKLDKKKSKNLSKIFNNMNSLFNDIDNIYNIIRLRAWSADMGDEESGRTKGLLSIVRTIHALYNSIQEEFTEKTWYGSAIKTSWSERMATMMDNLKTVFSGIDAIYDIIRNREWSADINSRIFGSNNLVEGVVNKVTGGKGIMGFMHNVKTLYTDLARFFGSDFKVDQSDDVSTAIASLEATFRSIDSIYALLRERQWTVDMASKIGGIISMLNEIGRAMPSLVVLSLWKVEDVSGKIDMVTNAIKSIASLSSESASLEGIDLAVVVETLRELVPQIEEIGKAMTEGFIKELDFDKMAKTMKDGLDKVLKSTDGYQAKFRKKAREIAGAFESELQSELGHINVSATITVRIMNAIVQGIGTVASAISDAVSNVTRNTTYRADGGIIYRAGGGSIFKPRGTDTVPAMLSVGEYVHNRHAVALFGREFMDKVNSLDIDGAMRAMHSRFGERIASSRVSTVNNIVNNNNNQQMTQNVYTNNPAFARLRRNRYIGAL